MLKSRYIVIAALVFTMVIPLAAKKVKTAKEKDNVLTDLRYNYTLNVLKNWKTKTFKEKTEEPESFRALLLQKNYMVNQEARDLGADFTIPEIQIYVCESTITGGDFVKQLRDDIVARNSDNAIINNLNLVLSGEFIEQQKVMINGIQATQALFKRKWQRVMQGDPLDPKYRHYGGRIVRDIHDVHEVYAFNNNGRLYVIQTFVENEFYMSVKEEFDAIVSTLKLDKSQLSKIEAPKDK